MITSDNDERIPRGYLILRPEELKPLGILRFLFTGDVKKSGVDSSETREPLSFRRRWIIFVSLVTLKLLKFFSGLIASFGSAVEFFSNLFSNNTFSSALFLRGDLVKPKDGDKYYAALSIMCSQLAYKDADCVKYVVEEQWNMKYLGFNNYWNEHQGKETTQAITISTDDKTTIASNDQETTVVIAFRGTEIFNSEDWCSDFDVTWYELPNIGRIHGGFMKALGLQSDCTWPKEPLPNPKRSSPLAYYSIRNFLKTMIAQNENTKIVVTGHSLGGALAILFVAVLMMHDEMELLVRIQGVYTFGQPRVGDSKFSEFMEKKLLQYGIKYYRFIYNYDIVPRLPVDDNDWMFQHFGTCIHFNRHYQAKVLREQSNDRENYFSLRGVIKILASDAMELIRSFTIVYERGPEFKEGWLLRFGRVLGMIDPFIPAILNHSPREYVNATLLCSPSVFSDQ